MFKSKIFMINSTNLIYNLKNKVLNLFYKEFKTIIKKFL